MWSWAKPTTPNNRGVSGTRPNPSDRKASGKRCFIRGRGDRRMTQASAYPRVIAVCVSKHKGTVKTPVDAVELTVELGISGDAHAGPWHRQLSLLALESIRKMRDRGLEVEPGSFAENVTTEGLDLVSLPVGTRLQIGDNAVVEITQIGKECHTRCAIYYKAGDCVMPKEGVFARIVEGGRIQSGDRILLLDNREP